MSGLFRLDGKIALVTGATAGMGRAMALALAEAGSDVVVHDRTAPDETAAAIAAFGRRSATVCGDFSDSAAPARVVRDAEAALGPIDILINNAGTIRRAPAAEHSDEDWDFVLAVDLSSAFRMAREVGRRMMARGDSGKIVNICSLLSFQGGILVPSYAAAKGGLAQLTKVLANEWAAHRITVNGIAPGYIATDNTAPLRADPARSRQILDRIPAGRWGEPADVTGAAVFLCSRASDYVNGHILVVDGGWLAR
ncbi:MAG: 2-dehydro-3-deoxy-D-gluconate 5-dehydrogenase KduD [Acidobacteria bacterium]|nr:2-dehydro-3-deoxy-D-gluconate 5-dehydrogenase KduD [Acidobacteriota bacterium]